MTTEIENMSTLKIERLKGPTIRLHLSADDWRLYNADTPEEEQTRDYAADEINLAVAEAIAEAPTRDQFLGYAVLAFYRNWGATDTAVREVLHDVLDEVYGD